MIDENHFVVVINRCSDEISLPEEIVNILNDTQPNVRNVGTIFKCPVYDKDDINVLFKYYKFINIANKDSIVFFKIPIEFKEFIYLEPIYCEYQYYFKIAIDKTMYLDNHIKQIFADDKLSIEDKKNKILEINLKLKECNEETICTLI
jgi:hypothetical protein